MDYISRAGAVISEEDGFTSPSAVAILTLGLPGVIGAKNAVTALRTGDTVTVDSGRGTVYRGIANAR